MLRWVVGEGLPEEVTFSYKRRSYDLNLAHTCLTLPGLLWAPQASHSALLQRSRCSLLLALPAVYTVGILAPGLPVMA